MHALLDTLDERDRGRLRKGGAGAPRIAPMLATLTHDTFSDPRWIFERKLDGERCLARTGTGGTHLFSRNGKPADTAYPELVDALDAQALPDCVLDGEVVAFDGGRTSFARLQPRMHVTSADQSRASGVRVFYYAFDLLRLDGWDLTALPLRRRKGLLRALVRWHDPLRYTAHRNTDGEAYWQQACRRGWEGVIAKRADSPYRGHRSDDWLKFKCERGQEMVVGGWTDPEGSRIGLGALLLGYHRDGDLVYGGKVGTGFDTRTLRRLTEELAPLAADRPPFTRGDPPRGRGVHWVQPRLVAQVSFTEWTRDGRLRHPRYQGLRRDKAPAEVVREE